MTHGPCPAAPKVPAKEIASAGWAAGPLSTNRFPLVITTLRDYVRLKSVFLPIRVRFSGSTPSQNYYDPSPPFFLPQSWQRLSMLNTKCQVLYQVCPALVQEDFREGILSSWLLGTLQLLLWLLFQASHEEVVCFPAHTFSSTCSSWACVKGPPVPILSTVGVLWGWRQWVWGSSMVGVVLPRNEHKAWL